MVGIFVSPANRLAPAATERIVLKTRGRSAADGRQLISRVPGISIRSVAGQVSVGVVRETRAFPVRELIVDIVAGRRSRLLPVRPGIASAGARAPSPHVVGPSHLS